MGCARPARAANRRSGACPPRRSGVGIRSCGGVPGARWRLRDDRSEPGRGRQGGQVRGCDPRTGLQGLEAASKGRCPAGPGGRCASARSTRGAGASWPAGMRASLQSCAARALALPGLRGVRAGAGCQAIGASREGFEPGG